MSVSLRPFGDIVLDPAIPSRRIVNLGRHNRPASTAASVPVSTPAGTISQGVAERLAWRGLLPVSDTTPSEAETGESDESQA